MQTGLPAIKAAHRAGRLLSGCCAVALLVGLSACSSLGVEPWQRDILSHPGMQFDSGGMSATFAQHFYFSKEASSGGQGFAAGGCGCN